MIKRHTCLIILIMLILMLTAGCADSGTGSTPPAVQDEVSIIEVESTPDTEDEQNNMGEQQQTEEKSSDGQTDDSKIVQAVADEEINSSQPSEEQVPVLDQIETGMVQLIVTQEFGKEILFKEMVEIEPGWTVADVLQDNLDVKTRYGGGFIDSINGLKGCSGGFSGEMMDWFYYVNGICPDVGGLDYVLSKGEVIWWDYHPWNAGPANGAVIGSYPEPFRHGYEGQLRMTTIMCSADDLTLGYSMEDSLKAKGVSSIKVMEMDENLLASRQGPTIVIGEWDSLKEVPFLQKFNQAYDRNGTGVHFNKSRLELIDIKGNVSQKIDGSAGAICAAGSGLGDACPMWLISGTDEQGLQGAVDVMLNKADKLSQVYNAAVVSGEIISLPAN